MDRDGRRCLAFGQEHGGAVVRPRGHRAVRPAQDDHGGPAIRTTGRSSGRSTRPRKATSSWCRPAPTIRPSRASSAIPTLRIEKGITLTGENPDDPDGRRGHRASQCPGRSFTRPGSRRSSRDSRSAQQPYARSTICSPTVRNCVFTECHVVRRRRTRRRSSCHPPDPNDGLPAGDVHGRRHRRSSTARRSVTNCTFTGLLGHAAATAASAPMATSAPSAGI